VSGPGDADASKLEILHANADFSVVLTRSIEEGMRSVLGGGGTQAILFHLDLPSLDDPKDFHEKLSSIFGDGTATVERVILRQLHQSMGLPLEPTSEGDFAHRVELARQGFEAAKSRDGRK
jgi:hypothetical protein